MVKRIKFLLKALIQVSLTSVIVFGTMLPESPRHIGCIDPACDVQAVIVDAYESARFLCDGLELSAVVTIFLLL